MPWPILKAQQAGEPHFGAMPDAMTIAASGLQSSIAALAQASANVVAATEPASLPTPVPACGFTLGYNPSAPSTNLQDLVALPPVDPVAAITGQMEAADGVRANLVVYRIAADMYRALQRL